MIFLRIGDFSACGTAERISRKGLLSIKLTFPSNGSAWLRAFLKDTPLVTYRRDLEESFTCYTHFESVYQRGNKRFIRIWWSDALGKHLGVLPQWEEFPT